MMDMYMVVVTLKAVEFVVVMFAIEVPAKAKNRNMVVPTNSPTVATKSVSTLVVNVDAWKWGF